MCLPHSTLQLSNPHAHVYEQLVANTRQHQRCFASHSGGGRDNRDKDPTLGDFGSELVTKIKQLPGTIYQGLSNLAGKLTVRQQSSPEPSRKRPKATPRSMVSDMFGGGVMGTVMGHTLGRAVDKLAKGAAEQLQVVQRQMQAAQQQADKLQQTAAQAIKANAQLRQHLGGDVDVAPPISQSSNMQILNGQTTQTIKLVMPVVGSNGRTAHAHIQTSANGQLDIQVQLPNGQVVTVDSDDASSYEDQDDELTSQKGRVIDADWREVR